jgi:hypothetical protein
MQKYPYVFLTTAKCEPFGKLKKENSQVVSATTQLKFHAPDGNKVGQNTTKK